jgi:hypothetical protein
MQLTVQLSEQGVDLIDVSLRLIAENADEHCACQRHASAHRRCRLAVRTADFQAWRDAQRDGSLAAASDLLQDVTLLWDQALVWNEAGSIFHWQDTMPKSVIALQLIERLRWSEQMDEVLISLEQLLLEKEFNQQLSSCSPTDPDVLRASAADRHQTL